MTQPSRPLITRFHSRPGSIAIVLRSSRGRAVHLSLPTCGSLSRVRPSAGNSHDWLVAHTEVDAVDDEAQLVVVFAFLTYELYLARRCAFAAASTMVPSATVTSGCGIVALGDPASRSP